MEIEKKKKKTDELSAVGYYNKQSESQNWNFPARFFGGKKNGALKKREIFSASSAFLSAAYHIN